MKPHTVTRTPRQQHCDRRRGVIAVCVMLCMIFMLGIAALAVDIGMLYSTQAEIQRTADATALAAAEELLDQDRLEGGEYLEALLESARDIIVDAAARNPVLHLPSVVDLLEDVEFGYTSDLATSDIVVGGPTPPNAVVVTVRRDATHGGSIALYFAQFLGRESQDLVAEAAAAFADGIVGYEVTPDSGNAQLLPFALHVNSWDDLLSGLATTGDNYSYDPETGVVSSGSDGIDELNLYPGAWADQLPPGNFGTVDIGAANNSAADIARQILNGVNEEDLSYFGGRLELGPDGTLLVNGDTGLSAGFKDELEAIKGQPRAILMFSQVSGNGNNAMYTVVAFAGIRIMNVKLTGNMNSKNLIIQPAVVVDGTAIAEPGPGPSYYVYRPVQLVR